MWWWQPARRPYGSPQTPSLTRGRTTAGAPPGARPGPENYTQGHKHSFITSEEQGAVRLTYCLYRITTTTRISWVVNQSISRITTVLIFHHFEQITSRTECVLCSTDSFKVFENNLLCTCFIGKYRYLFIIFYKGISTTWWIIPTFTNQAVSWLQ